MVSKVNWEAPKVNGPMDIRDKSGYRIRADNSNTGRSQMHIPDKKVLPFSTQFKVIPFLAGQPE